MKYNKKIFYIILFSILYLITAFSSFWHAVEFFELSNVWWMGIILAFAFEVGQAAVLLSILTSNKERTKITPWVLMGILTLVQIIGNVYSSYKYIMLNSPENLQYFKEPIFIWTDLPDAQATVIITYISSAILPLTALLLTSMITNYLSDTSEENNLLIESKELDGPPEGEGRSDEQEIKDLNILLDNKDKEIERLKDELEKSTIEKQEIVEDEQNKYNNNDRKLDMVSSLLPDESKTKSEDKIEAQSEYVDKILTEDNKQDIRQDSIQEEITEQPKKESHFINL